MAPASSSSRRFEPPPGVLAAVLDCLPLAERLPLRAVSKAWLEAVRASVRGVVVQLGARSRDAPAAMLAAPSAVATLALLTPGAEAGLGPAAAAQQAARWDPHDQQLWQAAAPGPRLRPAAAAWHLKRLVGGLTARVDRPPRRPRRLALLLAAPEWDAGASEVQRMLQAAGAEGLVEAVSVPLGLVRLEDGALAGALVRCNTRAAALPPALQVRPPCCSRCTPAHVTTLQTAARVLQLAGQLHLHAPPPTALSSRRPAPQGPACYTRLECLALQLSSSDDLPAVLACISARTLPALRCLALLADAGAGVAADLAPLAHGGLTRLDLHGVQLPAGFSSLQQLTGEPCCRA